MKEQSGTHKHKLEHMRRVPASDLGHAEVWARRHRAKHTHTQCMLAINSEHHNRNEDVLITLPNEESENLKEDPEDEAVPILTAVPYQPREPADHVC